MKEYQKILMDRYGHLQSDKMDRLLLESMCTFPSKYEFEDEMLDWLKEHPDAGLQEVAAFEDSFLTPLEIVDDDDLYEEWAAECGL